MGKWGEESFGVGGRWGNGENWYHGKINSQISYTSKNYKKYSMLTNHTETGSLSSNLTFLFFFVFYMATTRPRSTR
jgi:hypothetical protein